MARTPQRMSHITSFGVVEIREIYLAGSPAYELWFIAGGDDCKLDLNSSAFDIASRIANGDYDKAAGWPISREVPSSVADWGVSPARESD